MKPMTKEEARAFVNRWLLVEQLIVDEIRNTSPQVKARQIAAAYQAGRALGLTLEDVPFQEWQHLRQKLNVR